MWKLVTAAGFWLLSCTVDAAPTVQQYAGEFHQLFLQKMQKHKIPGGVYVIVQGDKILRIGTYGVREAGSKAKVDANTVFRLASVSKTFAGGLASQLVHEGRFNWEDKVTYYVPGLKFRSPAMTAQLKVEHLLGQNAGLTDNAFDELIEAGQTPAQILPKFQNINPRCVPGRCYGYQNVLFSQIETVMMKTTGLPYEKLVQQRIFEPLQMRTASVGYAGFLASNNRAMPHLASKRGWVETKVVPTYYRVNPAAGVNASATDMGQWLIARLGHRPTVLSAAALQDVHTPRVKTADNLQGMTYGRFVNKAEYGLGLRIYQFGQHRLYHHGGLVRGYRTDMSYSPQKNVGIAILVNAQSNVVADLASEFWSTLLKTPAAVPLPAAKPVKSLKAGAKKKVKVKKPVRKKSTAKAKAKPKPKKKPVKTPSRQR